jgi:hypothetical protein
VLQIPLAVPSDTKLPAFDTNDGGEVVYRLLQDPEKWVGKIVHLTGGYVTPSEMAAAYTKGNQYIIYISYIISYWKASDSHSSSFGSLESQQRVL